MMDLGARAQQTIDALQAKKVSLGEQSALASAQLEKIRALSAKGDAVTDRVLAAQQTASQYQTALLETSIAILHAQDEAANAKRGADQVGEKRREADLEDLRTSDGKLAEMDAQLRAQKELDAHAEMAGPGLMATSRARPIYHVTRRAPQGVQTLAVLETDFVLPDDTIEVSVRPDQEISGSADR